MERHRKGDLTEAIVIAELKERGISVSKPFGDNERYDLLVEDEDGELHRIQVKTGRYANGSVIFDGASQRTNCSGSAYETYAGDVDYFIVYCGRFESLFLVDADQVNTGMSLRVDDAKIDHPAINWARDFEFDRCWPPEKRSNPRTENPKQELPTHRRGDATEARVIAELLRHGVSFTIPPTDNERFDLVLESPAENFYRVQVKTAWITRDCVTFRGSSSHVNAKGVVHKPYDGDIDYFLVYEPSLEEMYFIAEDAFNRAIFLRVDESKQPDRTAHQAEDHLFDRKWPPENPQGSDGDGDRPQPNDVWNVITEAFEDLDGLLAKPEDAGAPYDVLVETTDRNIVRIVIRSVQTKEGRIFFHPENDPDNGDFDYYLLYGYDTNQLYLIDPSMFDSSITLWVAGPKQVRRTTLRAEDYELERQWPPSDSSRVRKSMLLSNAIDSFHALGVELAYPAKDNSFDIWVESADDRFLKVAIEPGWVSNGCIRLKPDSKQAIDYFLLVCRELETCYLIGTDEFDVSISLRIDPPERDDGTVRYAEDYELSSRWPIESPK